MKKFYILKVTDARSWTRIRTKMSRIPNTGFHISRNLPLIRCPRELLQKKIRGAVVASRPPVTSRYVLHSYWPSSLFRQPIGSKAASSASVVKLAHYFCFLDNSRVSLCSFVTICMSSWWISAALAFPPSPLTPIVLVLFTLDGSCTC